MPFKYPSTTFRVHDFLIDFFGSLIPGFIFIVLSTLLLLLPLLSFKCTFVKELPEVYLQTLPEKYPVDFVNSLPESVQVEYTREILNMLESERFRYFDALSTFRIEFCIFVLAISYVFGHIFFRLDPKRPDQRSVWRRRKEIYLKEQSKQDGAVRWPEYDEWIKKKKSKFLSLFRFLFNAIRSFCGTTYAKDQGPDVQFPYQYLYEYLEKRNLTHLLKYVPWKGREIEERGKDASTNYRSKTLINVMKARLQYACPEKCGMIIKNEAHVRLMSSLWYMLLILQFVAVLGFFLSQISWITVSSSEIWWKNHSTPSVFSLAMIALAFLLRYTIEHFIHYQRCREIVFVLETFHFASLQGIIINSDAKVIALEHLTEKFFMKNKNPK